MAILLWPWQFHYYPLAVSMMVQSNFHRRAEQIRLLNVGGSVGILPVNGIIWHSVNNSLVAFAHAKQPALDEEM